MSTSVESIRRQPGRRIRRQNVRHAAGTRQAGVPAASPRPDRDTDDPASVTCQDGALTGASSTWSTCSRRGCAASLRSAV